jgi:hypothetical protein
MLYVWLFKKGLLNSKNNPLLQAGSEGDLPHLSCSLVAHQHMDISKEKTESTLILSFLHNFQIPYMMVTTKTMTTSLKSILKGCTRPLGLVYRQVPRKPLLVGGDESAQFINNQI